MKVLFDADKDSSNFEKHGISLSRADDFELLHVFDDDRRGYGEYRRRACGLIDGQTHYLACAIRDGRV